MSTDEPVPAASVQPVAVPVPGSAPVEAAVAALPEPPKNITKRNPLCTVGRRKSSQARCRVFPGDGKVTVNDRTLEVYFSLEVDRTAALRPFALVGALKKYDVIVLVRGGGPTGQ